MGTPGLWIGFNICVLALLALDLFVFNRHAHAISLRGAALSSAIWVLLSLAFNVWIYRTHGGTPALEFFTGYLIEESLSLDNIFVFVLVFRAFGIKPQYQHRVLFWGILGAILLRGTMIAFSAVLVDRFEWILYLFGAFLIIVGLRMLFRGHQDFHPERNPILTWARRMFRMAEGDTGERFIVQQNGQWAITPLLLVLLVLEGTDLLFAVDSIPAVFGVTRDPFIVFSSNICAILGLRSFYFLLAGALPLFRYLDHGISAVLIFVGVKMLAEPWIHLPTLVSLGVVGGLLGTTMVASLIAVRGSKPTNA